MTRALLVIDVQNEYFDGVYPIEYPAGSLMYILKAMDAAAAGGIPIYVIQHASPQPNAKSFVKGTHGWDLQPDIAGRSRDELIEKRLPGSFTGTALEQKLHAAGVDTITICGYMTQMCCDTTARQAVHLGFTVEFLSDATGTVSLRNAAGSVTAEELHRAILVTQAARFSTVMPTSEWIQKIRDGRLERGNSA